MTPEQLKAKIETLSAGTKADVRDLKGGDHFQALIMSPAFSGKSTIERHRAVMAMLEGDFASGEVHALTMKTWTPEEKK